MPDVYRESRTYTRDRSSSPSDDEYRKTTVRRYKVTPTRVERVEREFDVIDEARGRHGRSSQTELLEVDRRSYAPDRPRSAFEPSVRDRDDHYTRVEYDRDRDGRTLVLEHKHHDEDRYDKDTRARVVYESKEVDRAELYSPRSPRDYERRSYWDDKETDVRIEKRSGRREDGTEIRIERRYEDRHDDDVELWRKETEYYEPAPPPIVIRPRPTEQKIIVQEAPAPVPVFIRDQQDSRELTLARHPSHDDDYYYRRESREVGPWRSETREEEVRVEHFDDHRPHHHHHRRHHRHHRHHSDGESVDEHYYKKKPSRDRSSSSSPHRKRHIAEGALAGAGLSAILASRRNENGELPEKRGRKVLAGAALGALGTEVVRRAHSAYEDKYGDSDKERSRSRSREKPHSRIKTGLGIAAVALAAAGAAKYYQSNKVEKEEINRGRPLHRYSDDESSRSPSRKRSKSRASSIAKAAAGTAAVVGLARHYKNKRSKSRDGKSRSRSRLRTGAEIVAAGLAGAGAKKLYDRHKDKKRSRSRSAHSQASASDYDDRDRRRSRSRSISRSGPTHPNADYSTADPELGLVEYGAHPVYTEPPYPEYGVGGAVVGYESAAEESRNRRNKKHRHRSRSRGDSDYSADSEADSDRGKKAGKKRSGSRLRDIATGAAAMGAAAIGIKKYNDKKDKDRAKEDKDRDDDRKDKGRNKDTEKDRSRSRDRARERERERNRERERERRRYEDESSTLDDHSGGYGHRSQSPAHASGGYYNPPGPVPPSQSSGFTQHPNTNLEQPYHQAPYNPHDYTGYPPAPPGVPPNSVPNPGGIPPPINPNGPEHMV